MSLRARSAASFSTIDVDSITQDFFCEPTAGRVANEGELEAT